MGAAWREGFRDRYGRYEGWRTECVNLRERKRERERGEKERRRQQSQGQSFQKDVNVEEREVGGQKEQESWQRARG